MSKTIVGLFPTFAKAQQVKQALVAEGYPAQSIKVVAQDEEDAVETSNNATSGSVSVGAGGAAGIGEKIGNYFRNLTGGDEKAHHHYAQGVNNGGALLTVTAPDDQASTFATLLKEHGAVDIEQKGQVLGTSSASSYEGTATHVEGETIIPIVEEQLVVGKREVDRGGVRIYSHVTETPVDADVTLHEERINVERRPVNRPATAADFQAGSGSVIELTAMGEEAVVGKTSHVVEEIVVGKQSTEHTEAIHDAVRKTEVEVQQLDSATDERNRY